MLSYANTQNSVYVRKHIPLKFFFFFFHNTNRVLLMLLLASWLDWLWGHGTWCEGRVWAGGEVEKYQLGGVWLISCSQEKLESFISGGWIRVRGTLMALSHTTRTGLGSSTSRLPGKQGQVLPSERLLTPNSRSYPTFLDSPGGVWKPSQNLWGAWTLIRMFCSRMFETLWWREQENGQLGI